MDLIILDRDGVINRDSPEFVKSPDEWEALPGSLEAIARLNHAGYRVVVASNQSGIGRRLFGIEALNSMHAKMQRQLAEVGGSVEAVFFCPHRPVDDCRCRKPRPGLLIDIGERLRVPLENVPMVGDSERDILAARAAGGRPILVRTGKGEATLESTASLEDVEIFDDLTAVAEALLSEATPTA